MHKIIGIEKLTDDKYLNYYKITYLTPEGAKRSWSIASRNNIDNLVCKTGKVEANCVCIIPRVIVDGEPALVITKEYRVPVGGYVYSFPAGIIDPGESPLDSALRELHEEIGVTKIKSARVLTGACLNSEGLTDESTITIEVNVDEFGKQNLQDDEDIQYEIVKLSELEEYLKGKNLSVRLGMYAPMAIREYELYRENKALRAENEKLKNKKGIKWYIVVIDH